MQSLDLWEKKNLLFSQKTSPYLLNDPQLNFKIMEIVWLDFYKMELIDIIGGTCRVYQVV